jgi:hypothetical protein
VDLAVFLYRVNPLTGLRVKLLNDAKEIAHALLQRPAVSRFVRNIAVIDASGASFLE